MKTTKFFFLFICYLNLFNNDINSQTGPCTVFSIPDPCYFNWVPDHILDGPSSAIPSHYFLGKKLEIRSGFIIDSNIEFNGCLVKINTSYPIQVTSSILRITCSTFKGCSSAGWAGFNSQNTEVIVENSIFNNVNQLFQVSNKKFHFVSNIVTNVTILGDDGFGHVFELLGNAGGDFAFYGNFLNGLGHFIKNTSSTTLTIGDNTKSENKFYNVSGSPLIAMVNLSKIKFENCRFRSHMLIMYDGGYLPNSTFIDNCKFEKTESAQFDDGLGIVFHDKVTITNSIFIGFKESIRILGTSLISNNLFENNYNAIKISLPFQSSSIADINNNTFTNNTIDIHATGAFTELSIEGNNFSGSDYGILTDGDNSYSITNNSFYNSYAGAIAYSNGTNANLNDGNQYNTLIGMHALENNGGFQFLDNCFGTSGGDVYLDGTISGMIGEPEAEAGNCFTKGGTPDITAVTNLFDYFRPDSKIGTCKDPIISGTYAEEDANVVPVEPCGSGTTYSGPKRNYCKFNFKYLSCKDAKILLAQIEIDITLVNSSTAYQQKIKNNIILNLKRCRTKLLKFLMGCVDPKEEDPRFSPGGDPESIWTGNEPSMAANFLKTSIDKYERAAYIGLSISLGQISEAKSYIQAQTIEDEEMEDFKTVQLLNIKRYEDGELFLATPSELNMLYNIAQKSDPLAAYARALYAQLTGVTIYPSIPRIVTNRSKLEKSSNTEIEVSPNPVSDLLNIKINNTEIQNIQVSISDITGKIIDQFNVINNNVDLNTSHWPKGIYFVKVQNDSGYSETKKVVKQ